MAKYFKFEKIGQFLGYGIKTIYQHGNEENKITMQSHLDDFMTVESINMLKLSIFLGINSFSNLELFEPHEMNGLNLKDLKECFDHLTTNSEGAERVFLDREKLQKDKFLEPSPCLNVSANPYCKDYCDWQKNANEKISRKMRTLLLEYAWFDIGT